MGETRADDGGAVQHTVAEAKATAAEVKQMAGGVPGLRNPGGRPRTDGQPNKSGVLRGGGIVARPAAPAPPAIPAFTWTRASVAQIGNGPFDIGYLIGGPDHEHWKEVREKVNASQCYDTFAYCFTELGLRSPLHLLLALAILEYGGALTQCGLKSFSIAKDKRTKKQLEKKPA